MWLETVVALGPFTLLLLALVPRAGWQAVALRWLHRLLRLLLALTIVACAAFHLRPEIVPNRVSLLLRTTAERLRTEMPAFAAAEGLLGSPWLVVALVAVVAGLPYLRALREALCGCSVRPHAGSDDDESRPVGDDTGRAQRVSRSRTPRLLKDILDDPLSPC